MVIACRLCGRAIRPTMVISLDDGTPYGDDGYRCVDFCRGIYPDESIAVQASMIATAKKEGWHRHGFTDPHDGKPLTLRELFDRHAVCLAVCDEFGV